jgi:hypothetical protein
MLRDDGVARIMEQYSYRVSSNVQATILANMELAQNTLELAPVKPWFLVSEDTYTTTTISEERVTLPADFLQEVEDATFKYRPDDWPSTKELDLIKDDYDVLRKNFAQGDGGDSDTDPAEARTPQAYALLGTYFRIFPLPDAVYTVRLIYFKKAIALTTNVENEWLKYAPLLFLGTVGMLVAKGPLRDAQAVSTFQDWIGVGQAALNSQNEARDHANRTYQMGGPHQ